MNSKQSNFQSNLLSVWITGMLLAGGVLPLAAVPYASGIRVSGGQVSFTLNEDADSVKLVLDGGAVTNDLGPLSRGRHTVDLGGATSFQIVVFNVADPGWTQISDDSDPLRFNDPRGVAVNTRPASPYFGRVYVANSAAGQAGGRSVGDGIYVLNADLTDAVGQGDTALTGGLEFSGTSSASPWRLTVGEDGNLYITDWSDTHGSLYVTDPDVSPGSGANVLAGPVGSGFPVTSNAIHGSIAAAIVEGSLANDNLVAYVIDEDLQTDPESNNAVMRNSLWRHDIGGTLPGPFVMPTLIASARWINFVSQTMDLDRGRNGYFYVSDYRSAGTDVACVWVLDPDGNVLWDSMTATHELLNDPSAPDELRATAGIAVSPDQKWLAHVNIERDAITIIPLHDGIPDLTNRITFQAMNATTERSRDAAFDAAGNLYVVSDRADLLRVFSPGGTSTAITGSDGTFQVLFPQPLTVAVSDDQGFEEGADPVVFTITRSGSVSEPLLVRYTLSGTAVNGEDYVSDPLEVTIPPGQSSVDVVLTPIDDSVAEPIEQITLTLQATPEYTVTVPFEASALLFDNEVSELILTATRDRVYEPHRGTALLFTITRFGDTNLEVFGAQVLVDPASTATPNVDFVPPEEFIYIPPGVITTNIALEPIDDHVFEGPETIRLVLDVGSGDYTIGLPDTAEGTIVDNEFAPAPVLFREDFNTDASARWITRFGANNGIFDATTNWTFDYSTFGIPAAPHSEDDSTVGLFVQVNKTEGTAGGSAGINFYPAGVEFSGDYELRFDMFLNVGDRATTEHAMAGLNHSGDRTNRWSQSSDPGETTRGGDGIWFGIVTDASGLRDYSAYTTPDPAGLPIIITQRTAASVADLIPSPPYRYPGSPSNGGGNQPTWADVEVSQQGNVITLKVNQNVILQVTNTYGYTSGKVMIGLNDQYDSIGSTETYVIFDNVEVVSLGAPSPPRITDIQVTGGAVEILFETSGGGQAGDFVLESTPSLSPAQWEVDFGATITGLGGNQFRASTTAAGATRFYRIRQ